VADQPTPIEDDDGTDPELQTEFESMQGPSEPDSELPVRGEDEKEDEDA
jgi:hypothetical protein